MSSRVIVTAILVFWMLLSVFFFIDAPPLSEW